MSGVASDTIQEISDADILARFHRSTNVPSGSRTLGFRLAACSQAEMRTDVEFEARADLLCNPMGQIQGGYLCAMLDEAMSTACLVASKMTCVAPTIEMKTSFLRPVMPGTLRAIGRVVRWGKTVAFMEGERYDSEGRLCAKASGSAIPTPFKSYQT
ncbi:PaaI family thioesterase [soil metagenome]